MTLVRRNPLQAAVGALLAVGLIVSAIAMGTHSLRPAAFTGCGYGYSYETGNNNQSGYGVCSPQPANNAFAEGAVFTLQPGQSLTVHGSAGKSNDPNGKINLDNGGTTSSASAHTAS